jgi:hypothetical protein
MTGSYWWGWAPGLPGGGRSARRICDPTTALTFFEKNRFTIFSRVPRPTVPAPILTYSEH